MNYSGEDDNRYDLCSITKGKKKGGKVANELTVQAVREKLKLRNGNTLYIAAQEQLLDSQVREQEGFRDQGTHAKS